MSHPDVSVIVVTYNDADHLAGAVRSVLAQTHTNLEVIISDDHSTDATPEVARELAASDARVRYHRRAENSGAPGAPLNDGLRIAEGDYVMILDSDDQLAPTAVTAMLNEARRSGAEIVSGQMVRRLLIEGGRLQPWFPKLHRERRVVSDIADFPEETGDTSTSNKLYLRSFLEQSRVECPEDMLYEDLVHSARTLAAAKKIAVIPDVVYYWNVYPRDERLSITNSRHQKKNLVDRLRAVDLAWEAYENSGETVLQAQYDKLLAHHLRFYMNDFLTTDDDEWCQWVLDAIRPWIERVPIEVFERRFLGDRLLYAAALSGDVEAVRAVLLGKRGGGLVGRFYREGSATVWAPRELESRPSGSDMALALSDVSEAISRVKPHAEFAYLHLIESVESGQSEWTVRGFSADPHGVMRTAGARLSLEITVDGYRDASGIGQRIPVELTEALDGVRWSVKLPLPQQAGPEDGSARSFTMVARSVEGIENRSPLQMFPATPPENENSVRIPDGAHAEDPAAYWEIEPGVREASVLVYRGQVEPTPKHVVVLGDVSWGGGYHLGDEAMAEVAVEQLLKREVQVTQIAGDPAISAELYGAPAVAAFGFGNFSTHEEHEDHLAALLAAARGAGHVDDALTETIQAILTADAVVIAGGGNLNSSTLALVYERLALKRIAEIAQVPLYVTSQTVGPHLKSRERALVREIACYARVFGTRERTSTALMREVCGNDARIVRTLDDALLLDATGANPGETPAEEVRGRFGLTGRYVVGSFTYHAFSTGLARAEYYRDIAQILDGIATRADAEIVLAPHLGKLGEDPPQGTNNDIYAHDQIVSYTTSGRVRALPLLKARDVFAITAEAEFTVSTRYHPVVFAAALGVPAIGIVTSYYSSLRMRGAMRGYGMESFAIPFEHWESLFGPRIIDVLRERRDEFAAHLAISGRALREYQSRWWDGIVASINGTGQPLFEDAVSQPKFEWTDERNAELLAVARVSQEGTNMYRLNNSFTIKDHSQRLGALERQVDGKGGGASLAGLQETVARLQHRMRPPGANLRDRARQWLRARRNR